MGLFNRRIYLSFTYLSLALALSLTIAIWLGIRIRDRHRVYHMYQQLYFFGGRACSSRIGDPVAPPATLNHLAQLITASPTYDAAVDRMDLILAGGDPWGQSLKYEWSPKHSELRIRSIGPDQSDDHGLNDDIELCIKWTRPRHIKYMTMPDI